MQSLAFKSPVAAGMTFGQLQESAACPFRPQPSIDDSMVVPSNIKTLFILGAQKGGTTWLASALKPHRSFKFAKCKTQKVLEGVPKCAKSIPHNAIHQSSTQALSHAAASFSQRFRQRQLQAGGGIKEVHYFDTWPLPTFPFTSLFPAADRLSPNQVLVDATPAYLYESWAPALIKKVVPHARFVVRLRVRWCCISLSMLQVPEQLVVFSGMWTPSPALWLV